MNTNFYDQLCLEETQVLAHLNAIRLLKTKYEANTHNPVNGHQPDNATTQASNGKTWPAEYIEGLTKKQLFYVTVCKNPHSDLDAITDAAILLEPSRFRNRDQARIDARNNLTVLLNQEKAIRAKRVPNSNGGVKYEYYI